MLRTATSNVVCQFSSCCQYIRSQVPFLVPSLIGPGPALTLVHLLQLYDTTTQAVVITTYSRDILSRVDGK